MLCLTMLISQVIRACPHPLRSSGHNLTEDLEGLDQAYG